MFHFDSDMLSFLLWVSLIINKHQKLQCSMFSHSVIPYTSSPNICCIFKHVRSFFLKKNGNCITLLEETPTMHSFKGFPFYVIIA